jgi:hypothetical protein
MQCKCNAIMELNTWGVTVEVFDIYITTQMDGNHTISRRMDNETKTNKTPKLVF